MTDSYRPGMAQRVGRGMALLFNDRGTRRGWVVSNTTCPHFTPGKDPVPIVQEAGWAPGPVWTGGKSRPRRDSIPDRPARSQSLYRLSYPAHTLVTYAIYNNMYISPTSVFKRVSMYSHSELVSQIEIEIRSALDINRLTLKDPYMGRTAPLTSKRCILYIYSTNIDTEYFKHALYSPFFLFKMQFVS